MVRVGMTAAGEGIQVMCCMALAAVIDIAEPVLRTVCTGQPPEIVIEGTVLHHHDDDVVEASLGRIGEPAAAGLRHRAVVMTAGQRESTLEQGILRRSPHARRLLLMASREPRSYTAQRHEFQQDYVRAFRDADEVVFAALYRPDRYTKETALDLGKLVHDLASNGKGAKQLKDADAIVADLSPRLKDRDVVLIMSNGGFGGIHEKLLAALTKG